MGDMQSKTTDETKPTSQLVAYNGPGASTSGKVSAGLDAAFPDLEASAKNTQTKFDTASNDPSIPALQAYNNRVLSGAYLNGSPQFTGYLNRLQAMQDRSNADSRALATNRAAMTGNTLSTANTQALRAGDAAANARFNDMKAGLVAQNYGMERGYQNAAPAAIAQGLSLPGYLSGQGMTARLLPYQIAAQISAELAGANRPNQIGVENIRTTEPGLVAMLGGGLQAAGSAFGGPYGAAAAGAGNMMQNY